MNDKKPVPPSLAEFAVEQLSIGKPWARISPDGDLLEFDEAAMRENAKGFDGFAKAFVAIYDAVIEQRNGECVRLHGQIEDLKAQLEGTESRRENAARNSSAFENRMGDLQVENGRLGSANEKLTQRIKDLKTELAALKAQPSAGVVLPERMVKTETSSDEYDMCADTHNACLDEVARLNPCRATCIGADCSATDGVSHSDACLAEHEAAISAGRAQPVADRWPEQWKREGYNGCVKTAVDALRFLRTNRPPAGGEQRYNDMHLMQIADDLETTMRKLLAAAPSAQQKESGDE